VTIQRADVAVIGGGIMGLANAWEAARRGLSVVLFERDHQAQGASIRNFGMIWPIGQPPDLYPLALRTRERWLELGRRAVLWCHPCGSLHVARAEDEWRVLQEFAAATTGAGPDVRLLEPGETRRLCPAVRAEGLLGAIWSPNEACIDPRQAITRLPLWLADTLPLILRYGSPVADIQLPRVRTSSGETWHVDRAIVCSGSDFHTLYPDILAASGLRRCKLQMLRTSAQPGGWRLGPHVAAGLTLCHYASFRDCPSLPRLRARFEETLPEYIRLGIHVMASQNQLGEVVIGDSHEYDDFSPFDKAYIDDLILSWLRTFLDLPDWTIAQRWHGVYAKHPTRTVFTHCPQPGVRIMVAPGGAGMTLSFGLAERMWESWPTPTTPLIHDPV
jgi:D-hydroxyproline dehydrogenase subunit beta